MTLRDHMLADADDDADADARRTVIGAVRKAPDGVRHVLSSNDDAVRFSGGGAGQGNRP
jgi:hypothetical protein